MNVLVDTCIWSMVLRRDQNIENIYKNKMVELINDFRVQMIGPIRQEVLSGVKSRAQFKKLKKYLSAFPDFPLQTQDFELAAEYYNINREKGIQGSNTDFIICSISYRYQLPIYTTDNDFKLYSNNIPILLLKV
ncbi:MAG: PIN domain-containing protein [bacterium]